MDQFPFDIRSKGHLTVNGFLLLYVAPVCGLLDADFIGERKSDSLGWDPPISCLVRSCMGSSCLLPFVLIFVFMFVFGRSADYLVLSAPIHRSFWGPPLPVEGRLPPIEPITRDWKGRNMERCNRKKKGETMTPALSQDAPPLVSRPGPIHVHTRAGADADLADC